MSGPPRLVLASSSPRRRDLLARLGVAFEVRPAEQDETPLPGERPEPLVLRLALAKARAAARAGETALGADTVVALGDEILGKPTNDADARRMLEALSGRAHQVWTGVALVARGNDGAVACESARACRTEVVFRPLTTAEIDDYVASGEPADKAGAYAIQGGAAPFVDHVDGDFTNVVGLPLGLVAQLLEMLHPEAARGARSRRRRAP